MSLRCLHRKDEVVCPSPTQYSVDPAACFLLLFIVYSYNSAVIVLRPPLSAQVYAPQCPPITPIPIRSLYFSANVIFSSPSPPLRSHKTPIPQADRHHLRKSSSLYSRRLSLRSREAVRVLIPTPSIFLTKNVSLSDMRTATPPIRF